MDGGEKMFRKLFSALGPVICLSVWMGGAASGEPVGEPVVSRSNAPAQEVHSRLSALLGQERAALGEIGPDQLEKLVRKPGAAGGLRDFSYDEAWLAAQPKATGDEQFRCLAEALYFEARGESLKGQFAVGEVILNRVDSGSFPDTVCGVIRQGTGRKFRCQFTYTCDGIKEVIREPKAYERVAKVARALMDGAPRRLTDGATYYHTRQVRPSWARKFKKTAELGEHYFYKPPVRLSMR